MQQPDHDLRISAATQATPRRIISLTLVGLIHLILLYALYTGLAQNLVKKTLDEIKVATVEPPKVKPPPPPPPPEELPPPPFVPPPDVVIDVPTVTPPPVVTHVPPPPAPPPPPAAPVTTPISVGRAHVCGQMYPPISQRNGEEGTTRLAFTVNTDGSVSTPTVSKSSGSQRLDDAAVSCAARWRYKAATSDGQAVAAQWQADVVWKLH